MTNNDDSGAWKEAWESATHDEGATYEAMTVEELLKLVASGAWGRYWSLWYAVAKKATKEQAVWPLFQALEKATDETTRYHIASALVALLGLSVDKNLPARAASVELRTGAVDELQGILDPSWRQDDK